MSLYIDHWKSTVFATDRFFLQGHRSYTVYTMYTIYTRMGINYKINALFYFAADNFSLLIFLLLTIDAWT